LKGYIYVWKYNNVVKYVGRTITTVDNRTNGHKRDYKNQMITGLKTKKFVEINKLPNEWNDIDIETIDVVCDIKLLGEKERYWYAKYSQENELWNSVIPDTSEYLGLNLEERILRLKDKQFSKFLDSFLKNKIYDIRHILQHKMYSWNLEEITPNKFNIIKNPHILDLNVVLINELNYLIDKIWFSYFIILMNENRELFEYETQEFYDNIIGLDFEYIFDEFKQLNYKPSLKELMNHFIENGIWSYSSNEDKVDYYIKRNEKFLIFDNKFKEGYKYLNFTKKEKKFFGYKEIILDKQKVLLEYLEKLYKEFVKENPDDVYSIGSYSTSKSNIVFELNTYIRGKKIAGGSSYGISTETFKEIDSIVREYVFDKYYYKKGLPNPFNKEEVRRYELKNTFTYSMKDR